jgi:hypothetical protein
MFAKINNRLQDFNMVKTESRPQTFNCGISDYGTWLNGSENYSGKENRRSLIAGRRFESGLFRKDYAVLKARRGDMR